jgi:hypothetical protein
MRKLFPIICVAMASQLATLAWGQVTPPAVPPPISITIAPSTPPPSATAPAATTAPAAVSVSAASAAATTASQAAPPIPPPDSVPDAVNPFADEKNLPKALATMGIGCTAMNADMHVIQFDGVGAYIFSVEGPDFELQFEPLEDWIIAPKSYDESFAFVYSKVTDARLSFCLYGPKEFLPDLKPTSIVQYLEAIREDDPKNFILTTPIPPGIPALAGNHFANYNGQGVTYATTSPVLRLHHDWFVDLNGQYLLVIKLTSPPGLISRLENQILTIFNRGVATKGLGIVPPSEAPPADTGKPKDT